MAADKMILAHQLKEYVDEFVRKVNKAKSQSSETLMEIYRAALGEAIAQRHSDVVHQVLPQCSIFISGTIFRDLTGLQGKDPREIPSILAKHGDKLISEHLLHIIDYAKNNPDKADKSWPVLLKSNSFFVLVMAYIQGIRAKSGVILKNGSPGSKSTKTNGVTNLNTRSNRSNFCHAALAQSVPVRESIRR